MIGNMVTLQKIKQETILPSFHAAVYLANCHLKKENDHV